MTVCEKKVCAAGSSFGLCQSGCSSITRVYQYDTKVLIFFFSVLNLLIETFQSSKTHLLLANAHCPSLSFTPVCLEFALALGRLIKCTLNCLYDALCDGQPSHVSHTSRTLVTLFEQVPFNRLENGLLDGAITNLQRGLDSENPVVKIAILGIFAVLPTNHPEVCTIF